MKIEILVADAWVDITEDTLVQNCRLRYAFGDDDFKYAPDVFDFSIRGRNVPLIKSFLRSTKKVEIRVHADPIQIPDPNNLGSTISYEEPIFHGDIEAGSSITIENNYGNLSLSAMDLCQRLQVPCPKLVYISGDLQEIANVICTHAGVTSNFPIEVSNTIVRYLVREQDDEDCFTLLNTLLWEFGWNMYYDPTTRPDPNNPGQTIVNGVTARRWWFTETDDDPNAVPIRIHRVS